MEQLTSSSTTITTNPTTTSTDETFFRRPLPPPAIEFSSQEGIEIFTQSLISGYSTSFFKLSEQLTTQDEPTFCGLASLVTVLNACEIDPGRKWKGVWRYYSQELLDCCIKLEEIKQIGVNFAQLVCLAKCNGLDVIDKHPDDVINTENEFRQVVKKITSSPSSDNLFLIVSYSRGILGQTGTGHFSPIGAYHPERDLVLILDVARFKYKPHWVPLAILYQAMNTVDESVIKKRGWMELQPNKRGGIGVLPPARQFSFSLNTTFEQAYSVLSIGLLNVGNKYRMLLLGGGENNKKQGFYLLKDLLRDVASLLESVLEVRFCSLCDNRCVIGNSNNNGASNSCNTTSCGGSTTTSLFSSNKKTIVEDTITATATATTTSSSTLTVHNNNNNDNSIITAMKRDILSNKLAKLYEPDAQILASSSDIDFIRIMYLLALDEGSWDLIFNTRGSNNSTFLTDFVFVPIEEFQTEQIKFEITCARLQIKELRTFYEEKMKEKGLL
jgi:hypothetical protein